MAALRFGKVVGMAAIIDTREERISGRSWQIARGRNCEVARSLRVCPKGGRVKDSSGPLAAAEQRGCDVSVEADRLGDELVLAAPPAEEPVDRLPRLEGEEALQVLSPCPVVFV